MDALMEVPVAPSVTHDEMELVKRTVAAGATADELRLYLYDCARQGVHPLDKLIHFTKRSGKYTPITSIDFMRTRAADTGEYAGSDDAVFYETDTSLDWARVTVWRMVQQQRCPFTATARLSEYKPSENDFMWRKMPHTMLAKCAEALALRKGFPRQLAGLYAKEEMDQAESQAPKATAPVQEYTVVVAPPGSGVVLADSQSYVSQVEPQKTKNPRVTRFVVTFSTGESASTINGDLAARCSQYASDHTPVDYEIAQDGKFVNLVSVKSRVSPAVVSDDGPVLTDEDIPF